jgi:hypothetical protein
MNEIPRELHSLCAAVRQTTRSQITPSTVAFLGEFLNAYRAWKQTTTMCGEPISLVSCVCWAKYHTNQEMNAAERAAMSQFTHPKTIPHTYSGSCSIVAQAKDKVLCLIKSGTIEQVKAANTEYITAIRAAHQRHAN